MLSAVADTHAIIWYLLDDPRLSSVARSAFAQAVEDGNKIGLSTITLAEIIYLIEKGRVQPQVFVRLISALDRPEVVLEELPFDRAVATAIPNIERSQVPDLPDRVIAATAWVNRVPLISRDHQIRVSGLPTIW